MSDFADRSEWVIAQVITEGVAQARNAARLPATGSCHFCQDPVVETLLFCDADCRDDFEKEQAALHRAGRAW